MAQTSSFHSHQQTMEWPKISKNRLRLCDYGLNACKLYLFILLVTSHDVICSSEFVLFNSAIIFVLLFNKTAKLQLLSIMIRLEETKESLILVMSLRKDKTWC